MLPLPLLGAIAGGGAGFVKGIGDTNDYVDDTAMLADMQKNSYITGRQQQMPKAPSVFGTAAQGAFAGMEQGMKMGEKPIVGYDANKNPIYGKSYEDKLSSLLDSLWADSKTEATGGTGGTSSFTGWEQPHNMGTVMKPNIHRRPLGR